MSKEPSHHVKKILIQSQSVGSYGVDTLYYDLEMCYDVNKIINELKEDHGLQATIVTEQFNINNPHHSHIIIMVTGFSIKIPVVSVNIDSLKKDVIEKCKQIAKEGKDYLLYQTDKEIYHYLKSKLVKKGLIIQDLGNLLHDKLEFIKKFYEYHEDVYALGYEAVHFHSSESVIKKFIEGFDPSKSLMQISGWNANISLFQPQFPLLSELHQLYLPNKDIIFAGVIRGCKKEANNMRDHYGFYKIGYDNQRLRAWIKENRFDVMVEDPCNLAIRGWYCYQRSEGHSQILHELKDIYHEAETKMYIEQLPKTFKELAKNGHIDHCEMVDSMIAPVVVYKLNEMGYRSWIWDRQYILTDWNYETNPKIGYRTQKRECSSEMAHWNRITDDILNQWSCQSISDTEKELHRLVMAFEFDNKDKLIKLIREIKDDVNKNGKFQGCPGGNYAKGMNRLMLNYFLSNREYTVEKWYTYADFLSYGHGIEIKKTEVIEVK